MVSNEISIRIQYSHTDKMGFCYHGNYPSFYEMGRTELMRNMGMSYRELEEKGFLMPVISLNIKYLHSAYYDDEIKVKTTLKEMPGARITFYYEIFNKQNELINTAEAVLAFLNSETMSPCRPPLFFMDILRKHFA
jgi:acyl-CoA thioester hydrolase